MTKQNSVPCAHDWGPTGNEYRCARCRDTRPALPWDTIEPGLALGTGTGFRVLMQVGLSWESARDAPIDLGTDLQLETTAQGAREIAAKLIEVADEADAKNREHNLPGAWRAARQNADG